ncbi:MAG TPA: DUF423 domain-containing protein [Elusimicrobiota bacterium]|jgi:uncharacterized membrane protein YgdD (TMEM256/DUF423 family)|nr:DUF423 domain-containing protein [Elusimicrobiota bacterium]
MLLSVAIGAFGAHGLKNVLSDEMKAVFETGVRYQAYHSLALLALAFLAERVPSRAPAAGACFAAGILLFSGSLYALSLTGARKLGAITPLGGLLFLAGWTILLTAPYKP